MNIFSTTNSNLITIHRTVNKTYKSQRTTVCTAMSLTEECDLSL